MTPFFKKGPNFCTKFDPLNDFSVGRSSYHLKTHEGKNLQAFDFFNYGIQIMVHWKLDFLLILDYNLLIFKFRYSKFDLKDNFVNN